MSDYKYTVPMAMTRGTHYGNNYYQFKSRKIGRVVTAFSNLEYDNLITLEMNHEVEFFCEHPCEVSMVEEGVEHKTVLDVWVIYWDGREEFQKVKYDSEVNNPNPDSRVRKQLALQKKWCMYNNHNYVVRTDKDLYLGQYYMMNLEYMASKVRRYNIPADVQASKERELLKILNEKYLKIEDVCASGLIPAGMEAEFLSMMYYKGLVSFSNIEDRIINAKTEVYTYA